MQPVTLKSNSYSNTLWVSQVGLCLLLMVLLMLIISINLWLLVFLPAIFLFIYINHITIKKQQSMQFSMRPGGQLLLQVVHTGKLAIHSTQPSSHDGMTAEVKALWHLPWVLFLKLSSTSLNQPVYLTLFRAKIGPQDFSQLLVGLSQMNETHKKHP